MKQGFVVLLIIALLFIGMYLYAYYSVYLEKLKFKKAQKLEQLRESLRLADRLRKQEIRDEKARQMKARRAERQEQFLRLKEIRQELLNKGKIGSEQGIA